MTNEELEKLNDEICLLAEKYKLYHVSFCAMRDDDGKKQFVGLAGCNMKDSFDFVNSILLIGRLWQSAREKMIQTLNKYEERL